MYFRCDENFRCTEVRIVCDAANENSRTCQGGGIGEISADGRQWRATLQIEALKKHD